LDVNYANSAAFSLAALSLAEGERERLSAESRASEMRARRYEEEMERVKEEALAAEKEESKSSNALKMALELAEEEGRRKVAAAKQSEKTSSET